MRFPLNGKIRLTEEIELTFERNLSTIKASSVKITEVFIPEQKYINHNEHGICYVYTSSKYYHIGHAAYKYMLLCNGKEFILLDELQSLFCFTRMQSLNDINKEIKKLDELKLTRAGIVNFINKYIFP